MFGMGTGVAPTLKSPAKVCWWYGTTFVLQIYGRDTEFDSGVMGGRWDRGDFGILRAGRAGSPEAIRGPDVTILVFLMIPDGTGE